MKAFPTFIFLSLFLATTCENKSSRKPIEHAEWLIGTWENKMAAGSIFETWIKKTETELFGKSYRLNDQDTLIFETIQLIQERDSLFFIPTVKNQNNDNPVIFRLKNYSDTALVFENKLHDFPQVIAYKMINADSLVAEISGEKDGQFRGSRFQMKRVK